MGLGFTPSPRCSPAASSAGLGPGTPGWGGPLFQQHPAPANAAPLFLAEDETRCSCDAGEETLEVCKDAWGRGGKLGSSWRSWLLQSASQVAQLTPCLPTPAPAFDPSDKQGASSMLDGGEGLTKVPRGEPWLGSRTAAAFLPEQLHWAVPRAACV